MPRTTKEREVLETFGQQYELVLSDVMLAMERDSCGSDYGGTSWTTKAEADRVGRLLDLAPGDQLLDIGSGAGFDCFVAAAQVGPSGQVVGIDMTEEMLAKSRATAKSMGADNVEFREGLIEDMPVEDGWADVVISNGVINLCTDKQHVFGEIMRVMRPGGTLQFADIANGKEVPASAIADINLWTS